MFCSFCGHKNEEGNRFCSNCGRELGKTPPPSNESSTRQVDSSITRKSIKKDALNRNKGPLYLGYILQMILIIAVIIIFLVILGALLFQTASTSSNEVESILTLLVSSLGVGLLFSIVIQLVTTLCNLGMSKIALDISRDKTSSVGELFSYPIHNFSKLIKLLVINIVFTLVTTLIQQIPVLGPLVYFVLVIYLAPVLTILPFMIIDDEKNQIIELIKQANTIVTGKRIAYYALLASFIGWYLLAIPTLGLILLWLIPYQRVALSNFYLSIKKEKVYDTEKHGISDGGIIAITAIVYVIAIFVFIFLIVFLVLTSVVGDTLKNSSGLDSYDDSSNYFYEDDSDSSLDVYEDQESETITYEGLSLTIPYGYFGNAIKEDSANSKSATFHADDMDTVIEVNVYTNEDSETLNEVIQTQYDEEAFLRTCSAVTVKTINNNNWQVFECNSPNSYSTFYTTLNESKVYNVELTQDVFEEKDVTEYNSYLTILENSLTFTNNDQSV